MTDSKTCPKCNGPMTAGKIMKRNEFAARGQFVYVFAPDDGPGPSLSQALSGQTGGRKGLAAYCCEKCGFVEFYGQSLE